MQKGTFASYREKARQTLAGHWGLAALLMLVTFFISLIFGFGCLWYFVGSHLFHTGRGGSPFY